MIISKTILNALKRAVNEAGNPSKFAARLPGIKQTTVRNWLLGITKTISEENWKKLLPLLQEELADMDEMHYLIDEIGPDKDLYWLLAEWNGMKESIKAQIIHLIYEAQSWSSDIHRLQEAGLDVLSPEEKQAFLNKYGGLENLVKACNQAPDDGESIYSEISTLAIKSPDGKDWLLKKYEKLKNLLFLLEEFPNNKNKH